MDTQCKAVCYVRGGDPVKLAKDFVIRVGIPDILCYCKRLLSHLKVEKFRVEIEKPQPTLEALTKVEPSVPSTPNVPLGPRNTNGPTWRKPLNNGNSFAGNSPMGNFGANSTKLTPHVSRVTPVQNGTQNYKNDRPTWVANSSIAGERTTGPTTPLKYQRGEENGVAPRARFYAPPPTPAESEGQVEQPQRAQFKVDQILPTLVRKASKDRLPLRQENSSIKNMTPISEARRESPNPMMAALLQGSIPEHESYQGLLMPHYPALCNINSDFSSREKFPC